ncbi:MAG TPA: hypothetical protein VJ652_01505 [Noviherbaspirillum sp.]|nr:hypothetical protein [Noviherbaspirillum sp.]
MFDATRSIETEIGTEKRCVSCHEYWPADTEFFVQQQKSRDRLSSRCIACIRAGYWGSPKLPGRSRLGIEM